MGSQGATKPTPISDDAAQGTQEDPTHTNVEIEYLTNLERSVQGQQFTIEAMKQRLFALEIDIVNLQADLLSREAPHS